LGNLTHDEDEAADETEIVAASEIASDEDDTEDDTLDLTDIITEEETTEVVEEIEVCAEVIQVEQTVPAAETPETAERVEEQDDEAAYDDRPRRVRVLRLKRSDMAKALSEEDAQETAAKAESALSDEDEADLMRALAEVEAEMDPVAETPAEEPEAEEPEEIIVRDERPAGRELLEQADTSEDAEARLLEKAKTEMDAPESNRRRTALAHLKAAVAATRAEKNVVRKGDLPEAETAATPLIQPEPIPETKEIIRPRRPQVSESSRAERPRPSEAPLRLGEEQRGDNSKSTPIVPRRISNGSEEAARRDRPNFAAYAEEKGATNLPELLEAAAAYTACVQGRDPFTRPQVMTLLKSVMEDGLSREDALRAFGQLLREEKISKLQGGRFTVTETIRYQPRAMASGE
jgi:hypothetical protein